MDLNIKYEYKESTGHIRLVSETNIEDFLIEIYGERYRDYRERWKKAGKLEAIEDFPLSLEFETNNTCNYACSMCIYAEKSELHPDYRDKQPKGNMDFELYKRIIDEASEHRMPAATYGFWCEPLLHPKIVDMIDYGTRRGLIDMRIGTNGQLLDDNKAKGFIDAGLQRLEVSLDAFTKETFEKVRIGGDFDKVVRNIHNFLELRAKMNAKLPLLRVSFCKLDLNAHELDDFVGYWKQYADYFSIQDPINVFESKPGVHPLVRFETPREKPKFKCAKASHRMWMRFNGNGQSCGYPAAWAEFTLGTFPQDSLHKMWHHATQDMLRKLHTEGRYYDHPLCHTCALYTQVSEENYQDDTAIV